MTKALDHKDTKDFMSQQLQQKASMTEIRNLIPNDCFDKNAWVSLSYMCRDLLVLSTSFYVWPWMESTFSKWNIWYWLLWIAFSNVYGFFMWCLFVVGHDCGHGSFSEYPLLNAVCGHLCHTPLAVPFYAWAYSHKQHHKYHNHHSKDLSHTWFTAEEWTSDRAYPAIRQSAFFLLIQPFIGYFYYLYLGIPDGSHVWPLSKLYAHEKPAIRRQHQIESAISTASLVVFFAVFSNAVGAYYFVAAYVPCWLMFSFWLFMVTYMQHHNEVSKHGSIIYDDQDFNFLDAALQTIDRKFGKLLGVSSLDIDSLHHNITDCHVVHHIYFTKIPHYHLAEATEAVAPYLRQRGVYNFTDLSQEKLLFSYFVNMFLRTHFVGTFLNRNEK